MRRQGFVAAEPVALAVVAEQSVAVSSSRPEMHRRCVGAGWVRQPQTPTLELEPKANRGKITCIQVGLVFIAWT